MSSFWDTQTSAQCTVRLACESCLVSFGTGQINDSFQNPQGRICKENMAFVRPEFSRLVIDMNSSQFPFCYPKRPECIRKILSEHLTNYMIGGF